MTDGDDQGGGFWTDGRFRIAAASGSAFVFMLGLHLRFGEDPDPPPPPRKPNVEVPRTTVNLENLERSPLMYKASIESDSDELQIPKATLDDLSAVFPDEASDPHQKLTVGGTLETKNLRLSLRTQNLTAATSRGSIEEPHLVLSIENKTDRPLAFRVDTSVNASPATCNAKADYRFDAIALKPNETEDRTECIAADGVGVTVDHVETIAIPQLSYFYLSRVNPRDLGEDLRVVRGHTAPKGELCQVPDSAVKAVQQNQATWRDLVDFYARHNCEKFTFFTGYHAFTTASERPLPAVPGP